MNRAIKITQYAFFKFFCQIAGVLSERTPLLEFIQAKPTGCISANAEIAGSGRSLNILSRK